ncbi:hypothetical protein [Leptospira kobayashii]|nr:hypothetical protein [Leptospira kobayashii]
MSRINKLTIKILFLALSLFSCGKNQGVKNESLISLADADKEYSLISFLKQTEYFPNNSVFFGRTLYPPNYHCDREIYFDKSDFRGCMSQLSIFKFSSRNIDELNLEITDFVSRVCKLRRIIFLKDSITGGELNFCDVKL